MSSRMLGQVPQGTTPAGNAAPRTAAQQRATHLAWPLMLLLAACAAVRVGTMLGSNAGLHVDEAQYWDWSRELHWGYYSKPPVIALLIRISTLLAGDGLLGVRWLAMLCWLACSGVLWRLGMAMGSARAGLWAAGLLAATPAACLLGLVATTDAPLMLCWAVAMLASWRALQASRHPSVRPGSSNAACWWSIAGLAFGIGLLSKYTMAAFVLSWLLLAWRARSTAVWRGVIIAMACGALVFAPHLLWNAVSGWPTLRHTAEITAAAPSSAAWYALAEYFAGQLLLAGPMLVLLGMGLAWRGRALAARLPGGVSVEDASGGRRTEAALGETPATGALGFALVCALPLLAIGAMQALRHPVQINWVAPALLGLCLAAGLQARQWPLAWLLLGFALSLSLLTAVVLGGDLLRFRPGAAHAMPSGAALRTPAQYSTTPIKRARWDAWSRMRDWDSALNALRPTLAEWPDAAVVATRRDLIAHAAYAWRDLPRRPLAWPAVGWPRHHYEWQRSWSPPVQPSAATLLLTDGAAPPPAPAGHAPPRLLQRVQQGRVVLTLWMLEPQ